MQSEMTDPVIELAADRLKLLADPTRLRILNALRGGERSVLELAEAAGTGQPNASRHLALLLRARIVSNRQEGRQVFYRVVDPFLEAICEAVCGSLRSHLEALSAAASGLPRRPARRRKS